MRICYVVHQFLPRYFTGTEQFAFAVARRMADRGHEVRVFTLDPQFGAEETPFVVEDLDVEGLPVTRVHYWMRLHRDFTRLDYHHPYLGLRFGEFLDRHRPAVVHTFHLRHLGANLIDECHRRRVPIAVHLMDFWFLCPAVILTRRDGSLCDGPPDGGLGCLHCVEPWLERDGRALDLLPHVARLAALRPTPSPASADLAGRIASVVERPGYLRRQLLRADAALAPSRFLAGVFAANGYPAERLRVMPYGIDTARLTGLRDRPRPAGPPVFGYAGSIARHKGLHVLVEAFLRVRGDARLRVWGRAIDFAEYARDLGARARADARISFEGPYGRDELAGVLGGVSAIAVPSLWYENTPFVALEARAAGLPVIASDLGGIAEIVRHEVDGELFPRGDAAALARCLQRLVDEPARLAGYAANARPGRTLDDSADELEQLYRELTAVPRPPTD